MSIESTHPSFTQCPDCGQWYEGPGVPICQDTAGLTERKVCCACARLLDWQGCWLCGEPEAHECIDKWLCRDCAEADDWFICDDCSKGFCEGEIGDYNGAMLCEDCREAAGWYQCNGCNEWFQRDRLSEGADGDSYCSYCSDCWCDRFSTCDGCGEVFYSNDLNYCDDSSYCNDCVPDQEEFEPRDFRGAHSYTDMPSCRKFGVELETDSCDDYQSLEGGFWGAKYDGSISGKEFYSGVMYGDAGLEACRDICRFADGRGWEVDRHCGYHAHFDMSHENDDSLKAIACAYMLTYEVWKRFVPQNRAENAYCRRHSGNLPDLYSAREFSIFADRQGRDWINFRAYNKHTTFEVRLHQGTLDANEVCNWIRAHATFMDWASEVGWNVVRNTFICMSSEEQFEFIAQIWCKAGCTDLGEYYGEKGSFMCAEYAPELC